MQNYFVKVTKITYCHSPLDLVNMSADELCCLLNHFSLQRLKPEECRTPDTNLINQFKLVILLLKWAYDCKVNLLNLT